MAESGAPLVEIRLVPYDPSWAIEFEKEKRKLLILLDGIALNIEHTGSTSVPGLLAKPIIDILVGVENVDNIRALNNKLLEKGYVPTDLVQAEQHLIYSKFAPTHFHIHFVQCRSLKGTSHPRFRDKLKNNPQLALEYANLKAHLAVVYKVDPKSYSAEKGKWIQRVLADNSKYFE